MGWVWWRSAAETCSVIAWWARRVAMWVDMHRAMRAANKRLRSGQ